MVVIQGLGGIPEPKPERSDKVRSERDNTARTNASQANGAAPKDDVTISSEAQAAAEVARALQMARTQDDIRADKVAQARERIERGEYRNPEVVAKVAERIMKYLS